MNIKTAIKKAEKLSGTKVQVNGVNQHWVNYKGFTVSFYPNGRLEDTTEITCIYAQRGARSAQDQQEEYYAGSFYDNLTQAFKSVDTRAKA